MMVKGKLVSLGLAALLSAGCVHTKGTPQIPPTSIDDRVVEIYENSIPVSQEVIESTKSSTVKIEIYTKYSATYSDEMGDVEGAGSGIVIAQKNDFYYVLTAQHVVETPLNFNSFSGPMNKASETLISVDGVPGAKVVASNVDLDYALLEIPVSPQLDPYIGRIGKSEKMRTGDALVAIGFSLALDKFFSVGSITNVRFPAQMYDGGVLNDNTGFMFDTAISPGNSGGPLFTIANGELYLIGIAHAYYPSGQEMYIGKKVGPILKDIKKQGIDLELDYDKRVKKKFYQD